MFTRGSIGIQRLCKLYGLSVRPPVARNVSVSKRQLLSQKPIGVTGWTLLVIPVSTFCLGTWQMKRRKWKLNLIEDLKTRTRSEPRELPDDLSELENIEYCPVRVRGYFDHSQELYLGPRSLIKEGDAATESRLISKGQQNGYCVITPFRLSDQDFTILVNRGWVPQKNRNPATRRAGQVEGEVELVGVVRLNECRAPFTPENKGGIWFYRDLAKMAETTGASPVFLEATVESSVPDGPVGGQTRITLRNEHLSYILTWYSLSAATAFMWVRKFLVR